MADAQIKNLVIKMFKADTAYGGAAFYSDDDWLRAYAKLQKLVDYRGATAVFGALVGDDFDKITDL